MSRANSTDNLPPTARAIALLLASTPTVQDAQPGVLHQLLEFSYRYTSQVLSDALVYAEHAGRAGKVEMDDVVLAVQARVGWEFGGRVPKEVRCVLSFLDGDTLTNTTLCIFTNLKHFHYYCIPSGSLSISCHLQVKQTLSPCLQSLKSLVSDYPPRPNASLQ